MIEEAGTFMVRPGDVSDILSRIHESVAGWRRVAAANGISSSESERMRAAFDGGALPSIRASGQGS